MLFGNTSDHKPIHTHARTQSRTQWHKHIHTHEHTHNLHVGRYSQIIHSVTFYWLLHSDSQVELLPHFVMLTETPIFSNSINPYKDICHRNMIKFVVTLQTVCIHTYRLSKGQDTSITTIHLIPHHRQMLEQNITCTHSRMHTVEWAVVKQLQTFYSLITFH